MGRVYVLGAGASRFADFPLASDLWLFIQRSPIYEMGAKERHERVVAEIGRILKAYPPKSEQPDLEVLFTLLDLTVQGANFPLLLRTDWPALKSSVVATIVDAFRTHHFDLNIRSKSGQTLGSVKVDPEQIDNVLTKWSQRVLPNDVVISFNWDLLSEFAFWRSEKFHYSDGYGFEYRQQTLHEFETSKQGVVAKPSPVKVYKLHGSINWVQTDGYEDPSILDLQNFFPGGDFNTQEEYLKEVRPALGRRLIIPSYLKTLSSEAFLVRIWNQAGRALRSANEIIVIGYSLPLADTAARYLLMSSLLENPHNPSVTIVDPDPSKWLVFCHSLRVRPEKIRRKFEDWVLS
jgi:SIR2-like domain